MISYQTHKTAILKLADELDALAVRAGSLSSDADDAFCDWQKTLASVKEQLQKDIIRIAVVGAIKAGKSTLVNSLLKKDYLKRGAGVITSIVTRIRAGNSLRATLFFKTWEEINKEIEEALVLFPDLEKGPGSARFDIRAGHDREKLQRALDALPLSQLVNDDSRNANSLLLLSYLSGYDQVKNVLMAETTRQELLDKQMINHMKYTGNDNLAVFLKDIQLEIDSADIPAAVEIADCQGSDSPNPLHIAQIQDYLLVTHFIIYVISSRTGLRQADIRFLSMIKRMGIMDNIIFVVNCDFSEHDDLRDLKALIARVRQELSLVKSDPEIYAWSSLYNLFKENYDSLSPKDRGRYDYWKEQKGFGRFSDRETVRFGAALYGRLVRERTALLLKNQLERLDRVNRGLSRWTLMQKELIADASASTRELKEKIKTIQHRTQQVKAMIRNTLDGAVEKIKREIKLDVDRFFDVRSFEMTGGLVQFVRNYTVPLHEHENGLATSGLANTLYQIFQEFRHALNTYMTAEIYPDIVQFTRKEEEKVKRHFEAILSPYDLMVQESIGANADALEKLGIQTSPASKNRMKIPDIETVKSAAGLKLPPAATAMRYSSRIESEAIMRMGFYSIVNLARKILKKPIQAEREEKVLALKDGVTRLKRETERSVLSNFKDYSENIKYQYLFKLVDILAARIEELLLDEFNASSLDLTNLIQRIGASHSEKTKAASILGEIISALAPVGGRIQSFREELDTA